MIDGNCQCTEGRRKDGTCYQCKEYSQVYDKNKKRCIKPKAIPKSKKLKESDE